MQAFCRQFSYAARRSPAVRRYRRRGELGFKDGVLVVGDRPIQCAVGDPPFGILPCFSILSGGQNPITGGAST
jgi:hypothetical protein